MDRGTVSAAELMRIVGWRHEPDELAPFATEVTEEADRAREAITPRIRSDDVFWSDFRRRCTDLPEIRWPRVWAHVYDGIARERDAAEKAAADARRRAAPPKSPMERELEILNDWPRREQQQRALMTKLAVIEPPADYVAIAARRSDDLLANHERAQQQVVDLEAELRRLEQEHADIVQPDARLWFGVGILIVFTILGVVVPLGVMATGPRNLSPVRWVLYLFIGSLALLIGYIVVYLVQLTRNKQDQPTPPG